MKQDVMQLTEELLMEVYLVNGNGVRAKKRIVTVLTIQIKQRV